MEESRAAWIPLGTLLVREGLIIHEELELALAEKEQSGRRVGEVLVEWGWVSSRSIAKALAEQYQLTFVDLTKVQVDREAAGLLPDQLAHGYQALPFGFLSSGLLLLAIADPTDVEGCDFLKDVLGRPIRLLVADAVVLREQLADAYGRPALV